MFDTLEELLTQLLAKLEHSEGRDEALFSIATELQERYRSLELGRDRLDEVLKRLVQLMLDAMTEV